MRVSSASSVLICVVRSCGILRVDRRAHLRLVRLAEPAALLQGVGEDPLELRGDGGEPLLRAPEAVGLGQRGHGGLQLLVREHARDTTSVKLTALSHGAGCACKLPAAELHALLEDLPVPDDDAVLVAADTADDAAVYRVADDLALVSTADFFTPIVDDPYDFGRIAAANALSDVYAMGGTPAHRAQPGGLVARGASAASCCGRCCAAAPTWPRDAGVAVIGGHSIDDPEPKFGMAVTGTVHPDRLVRNSTARPGDELFLTKPVGGGVASTAMKRGLSPNGVGGGRRGDDRGSIATPRPRAVAAGASAMTDVTGFGLLGHLRELHAGERRGGRGGGGVGARRSTACSSCCARTSRRSPAAARRNRDWVEPHVDWAREVPEERRWLLCDAMTSGGLLVAAPARLGRARACGSAACSTASPGSIRVELASWRWPAAWARSRPRRVTLSPSDQCRRSSAPALSMARSEATIRSGLSLASSHRRAASLTGSPITVYSKRSSAPTLPATAGPAETPMPKPTSGSSSTQARAQLPGGRRARRRRRRPSRPARRTRRAPRRPRTC